MGEVVNLRLARKAKQRSADQDQAAANRAKHGRTKGEQQRQEDEAARQARLLDGARREPD